MKNINTLNESEIRQRLNELKNNDGYLCLFVGNKYYLILTEINDIQIEDINSNGFKLINCDCVYFDTSNLQFGTYNGDIIYIFKYYINLLDNEHTYELEINKIKEAFDLIKYAISQASLSLDNVNVNISNKTIIPQIDENISDKIINKLNEYKIIFDKYTNKYGI